MKPIKKDVKGVGDVKMMMIIMKREEYVNRLFFSIKEQQ